MDFFGPLLLSLPNLRQSVDRFVPRDDVRRRGAIFAVIASEARQSVDRFVPRDDSNREWFGSYLSKTGAG
jgi:hypothetical protein